MHPNATITKLKKNYSSINYKMRKISVIISLVFASLALLISCNSSECFNNQSTLPLAGFYSMQTQKAVTVDSLTVYGIGAPGDSILLDNGKATTLYMPMPLSGNSVRYVFHYNQKKLDYIELNDTLTIGYNCYPQFVSNECGTIYKYDVTDFSYTDHLIDSVAIPTMEFNNIDMEVIKIFYRTATE